MKSDPAGPGGQVRHHLIEKWPGQKFEHFTQAEPYADKQKQGQSKRFPQDSAELGTEQMTGGCTGTFYDHLLTRFRGYRNPT